MTFNTKAKMSAALWAKAVKEGRVVGDRAYASKRQASDAKAQGPGKKGGVGPKKNPGKVTEVVIIKKEFMLHNGTPVFFGTVLKGDNACDEIAALKDREPVLVGARAYVSFALCGSPGRWGVATAHSLSAGDKTLAQVSSLRAAKVFDNTLSMSQWVAMPDVSGVCFPMLGDGITALQVADHRALVFACESTAAHAVEHCKLDWHVTVAVRPLGAVSAVVDL